MEQVLPTDVVSDIPPQKDLWTNAPGELVWKYEADPKKEELGMTGFSWQVRRLTPGMHDMDPPKPGLQVPYYQASTPYRAVFYTADSAEEALACLLKGFCHLSREGSINPSNPHATGAPIIQHAMHVLSERLLWHLNCRQDHLVMGGYADTPGAVGPSPYAAKRYAGDGPEDATKKKELEDHFVAQMVATVSRDNEIISALGTAIAALARVKDL